MTLCRQSRAHLCVRGGRLPLPRICAVVRWVTTDSYESDEPLSVGRAILHTVLWSPPSGGGALTACCDGSRYGGGKRWSAYKKSVEALNCTNGVFGDPAPFSPKVCSCRSGVWLPVVDDALWFGKFPRVRQIAYHESLVLKL